MASSSFPPSSPDATGPADGGSDAGDEPSSREGPAASLRRHLDALYPAARVLVGEEQADALVADAFRRAAGTAPGDRPADVQAWLLGELLAARDDRSARRDAGDASRPASPSDGGGDGGSDGGGDGGGAADAGRGGTPYGQSAAPDGGSDRFREDVARETAERALPVAFAACSAQERLILTLDVLNGASDDTLAAALRIDREAAADRRASAHRSLRAALRDSLTGPERMLVDTSLPEAALHTALTDLLRDRYRPAPRRLKNRVDAVLADIEADAAASGAGTASPSGDPDRTDEGAASRASEASGVAPRLPTGTGSGGDLVRRGLVLLLLLAFVGVGTYAISVFFESEPTPTPGLAAFSVQNVAGVATDRSTDDPNAAEAYLRRTWDRGLQVPAIEGAPLSAVGRLAVRGGEGADSVAVPVLLYADSTSGAPITTYAYTYALLDRLSGRLEVDTALRKQIASEGTVVLRRAGDRTVLVWRRADDIFVAVSPAARPEALSGRITP
jgi:DNA-directed RNA polymerase specialized sigma24 family protein